ncbi:longitudinals lacking protein, isoforms H/M/V-like isoform X4 [Amphibalanus amphitrite]|uniref:longitudinals lacking protein, isoforms H/M/V-like isoform X4 n=1 Tax=Amphibalanus amphitrite TaxID=1232801 RepID=UPI001C91E5D9|nr:longitudinals lacking protein, isoforms H/M/V-like isoform X4 [Amphibalanus amphitrite]XP_043238970.1 longitudinals lacking protein, isoforms H/M/V-like isoform X4 [Amphibalanus amphitrite]
MTGGQKFCLRWDGFKSRLSSVFDELRREEELLDVTLCCDGGHAVKAHQILLSASSPSLRQLLKSNPCQHPVFFLKETSAEDLHAIIQFIYCGEVNVVQSQLASFIKTAEMLQIRGLSGDSDGDEDQTPTATAPRQSSAPPPREDDQPAPAEPRPSKRRRRRSSGTSDLSATYDASSSASAPASVTASSKTAAGVPAAASAAATASKSAIPSTSVSTDNRAVANVPKAASASVIAADVNVVSLDDIKTEQVDLSDDEGRSMDDPLGFFSSFEGHVDASSAAGPSSRDSHGGPSTAAGPSGQAGATAAGEPTAQEECRSLRKTRRSNQRQSSDASLFAVIDFDESPRRSAWPARFKNFRSDVEKNNLEFLNLAPEEEGRLLPPLTKDEVMTPELDVQILSSHVRATLTRREPLSKHEWREMMHCIYQRYLPYDHYIRKTRYWYLGMAQSIIDQFPFVFSHLNRRDAMGLVARRLKNKFKNSRRISTNKNEMRHGLSGLDDSPGSSVARRNSDENATEASNDPNITSLEQQSDGSTGAKGSDVTTNKAPPIPDIDQVSDHGSEELSTADDVDVLDEAS